MSQSTNNLEVASPCIGVCALDANDICEGCFRSVSEITRWAGMEQDEKRRVIERSWQRAKASGRVL